MGGKEQPFLVSARKLTSRQKYCDDYAGEGDVKRKLGRRRTNSFFFISIFLNISNLLKRCIISNVFLNPVLLTKQKKLKVLS